MIKSKIKTIGAIVLAGSFLLATPLIHNSFSTETSGAGLNAQNNNRKFLYDEQTKKTYGPKADIVWDKPTKVAFSHKIHTKDAGLTCTSCHISLFRMKAGAALANGDMTMASMAEGKFCGTCHDGSTAFATNTKCTSCHTNATELTPKAPIVWTKPVEAVVFYHKAHTEDFGLECNACHDGTFAMQKGAAEKAGNFTMQALYDGKYCGKCHDGSTAFASNTRCNTCHIGVKGYNRMMGNDGVHGATHKDTKAGH
ncbi:MAG: cytochrome c3 family protein [Desulfocapsaceae bacterium]|nr:cytochrome c3 family protein [Desulfocapsaceae bacterium]